MSKLIPVEKYIYDWVVQSSGTSMVRVIHVPSRLSAVCDIYASAHRNRAEAIKAIEEQLDEQ